jgi:ParB family chromosome partitioning protein
MTKSALGKGLSALLKEEIVPLDSAKDYISVNIEDITPGEMQPRKHFEVSKIRELADSIISSGLIQPIVVQETAPSKYTIIAGERRFRACKLAGFKEIPAVVRNISNKEILEIAIIENIQREGLNAIEEAAGYQRLISEFGYTQGELANSVGKSRSHVANILRMNSLTGAIKEHVIEGRLSMGHARCLIGIKDADEIAAKIIGNDLNVRQTEDLIKRRVKENKTGTIESKSAESEGQDDFILLGQSLSEKLGVKVVVENSWNGGKICIHYNNLEELDSILMRLN